MEQSRKAVSNLGMLLILLLFSSKLMTFKISIHWRRQVGICATAEFSRAVLRILWKREDNRTTKIQKQPLGHSSWNKPVFSQHHLSPEAQGSGLTPWTSYKLASPGENPEETCPRSHLHPICIYLAPQYLQLSKWHLSIHFFHPAVLSVPLNPEQMVQTEQKEFCGVREMQEQVLLEFIIKGRWEQGQTQSGPGSPPRRASQRTPNLISFTGQSVEEAKSGKDFFFPSKM